MEIDPHNRLPSLLFLCTQALTNDQRTRYFQMMDPEAFRLVKTLEITSQHYSMKLEFVNTWATAVFLWPCRSICGFFCTLRFGCLVQICGRARTCSMFTSRTACPPFFRAFIVCLCSLIKAQAKPHWRLSVWFFFYTLLFGIILSVHSLSPRQQLFSRSRRRKNKRQAPNPQMNLNLRACPIFCSFRDNRS